MAYDRPSVNDFKAYFVRDFPYGDEEAPSGGDEGATSAPLDFVLQADIQKALTKTGFSINEALASDQEQFTYIYLMLAAHNLVMSLRTSSQGVASQSSWLHSGKAAGPVSESFAIPDRILANPELSLLARTGYGMEYLQFVLPRLVGAVTWVPGRTLP